MAGGLFGTRREPGAVTVVDAPVSLAYARKARVAFVAVAVGVALATSTVLSVFAHPVLAVLLGVVLGLACGLAAGAVVRVWPVLRVLWWWSLEITLAVLAVLVPTVLARVTGPWPALVLVVAVAAAVGLVGPVRRFVAAWSRCLVARHRLRVCFAEFVRAASRSRAGCLPLVLWARPTPAGTRVWLWLRLGLDLADLEGKTAKIAVTCWASEARVVRASQRFAALVRVDLTRRDQLVGKVVSPLAALVAHLRKDGEDNAPVSPGLPPVGLDLADVPDPEPEIRGGRR